MNKDLSSGIYIVVPVQVYAENESGLSQISGSDADMDTVPPHVVARCAVFFLCMARSNGAVRGTGLL